MVKSRDLSQTNLGLNPEVVFLYICTYILLIQQAAIENNCHLGVCCAARLVGF